MAYDMLDMAYDMIYADIPVTSVSSCYSVWDLVSAFTAFGVKNRMSGKLKNGHIFFHEREVIVDREVRYHPEDHLKRTLYYDISDK